MATLDITPNANSRKAFKQCRQCEGHFKIACFCLVNPENPYDERRTDFCVWCRHPDLSHKVTKKTRFYSSLDGDEHKRAIRTAADAKRRTCQPPWADEAKIKLIYAAAKRISRKTGILHHVDHIIPVNHPEVCGLHIPENLQVITAELNLKKGNKRIVRNW